MLVKIEMKRVITLFLILSTTLIFTACKKDIVGSYAGVYLGTLSSQKVVKDSVEFQFERDASDEQMLALFEFPLVKKETNQYTADGEVVFKIIHILYPRLSRTQISNTSALFVFEKEEVTMELTYSMAGNSDSHNIRFIGKKK